MFDLQVLFDSKPVVEPELDYNLPRPKLSALIRQGATKYPQAFGMWWDRHDENDNWSYEQPIRAVCALGAAACAIGIERHAPEAQTRLYKLTDSLYDVVEMPTGGEKMDTLIGAIEYLNDDKRWTREQIADWLESIGY